VSRLWGLNPRHLESKSSLPTTELHPHIWSQIHRKTCDIPRMVARLAEWSKAWDLSSHNRKIAWVRTPHLARYCFANRLQWRNRLAHGTYRQYKELCRGCEFKPHLEQHILCFGRQKISPRPGIEPGPSTWQAEILTTRLSRNRYPSRGICPSRRNLCQNTVCRSW
jgi:hypothetical protein